MSKNVYSQGKTPCFSQRVYPLSKAWVFTKKRVKYWDVGNEASLKLAEKSGDIIMRVDDVNYLHNKEVSIAFAD